MAALMWSEIRMDQNWQDVDSGSVYHLNYIAAAPQIPTVRHQFYIR
jgi:hypothetical protein